MLLRQAQQRDVAPAAHLAGSGARQRLLGEHAQPGIVETEPDDHQPFAGP